jgi:hypothetical protein
MRTTRELIEILQEIDSPDKFIQVSAELNKEGYRVIYDTTLEKYFVSRDLRKEIKEAIYKEGLSIRQVALFLVYDYNSLIKYLNGKRPIPDRHLERLLAMLNL